ncbi:sigma-70 family RNA polymerase sigma factor [Candidatus Cloacimonadota bacterium]
MNKKFQDLVFNFVYYKVNDYHTANDITSQVMALYCLKCDYQDESKIKGWLINSAKNYLKKYYESNTRERKTFVQYSDQLHFFSPQELNSEDHDSLADAFHEAFKALSEKDLDSILLYLRCRKSIKKMQGTIGGSYDALKKSISRIRKKLKAETYKNLGFYGSKKIVTPELDNMIYQFLRRFKQNLEAGTLEKMHYYFSEVDLNNFDKNIKIKKIIEYEIEKLSSKYKAWVFYTNLHDIAEYFYIEFYIDDNNHLKVTTPPTKKSELVVIKKDSAEGKELSDLLEKYPLDKSGQPKIPKEELENILKQFNEKQKKH